MECYHVSPECAVYACGSPDDVIPDDVLIPVRLHGSVVGSIICRWNEWNNELSYSHTAGLPDWIVGLYIGDDYPDSAASAGYTFDD